MALLAPIPARGPRFDPPGRPELRPLTPTERRALLSGGGYWLARWGLPTPEDNPELHPYLARGLYPHPGKYEQMARRNPIIAAGLTRIEYYVASLDWRVTAPADATPEEERWATFVAAELEGLPGGLSSVIRMLCTAVQFGFSLQELVAAERGAELGLQDLVWIRPATIHAWVIDPAGQWDWVLQTSERGVVAIPRAKLLHFAWRGRSRAPEGESALRPLYYYDEAKRQTLNGDQITRQRFGVGTLVWTQPEGGGTDAELAAVERMSQLWEAGQQAYFVVPPGWEYAIEHGGAQAPDPRPRLEYFDHQASRLLDDTLAELGMARYGSHAVGSEMRLATQRQLTGVCREISRALEQQVVARLAEWNGWVGRLPKIVVTGFEDRERLLTIVQLAQQGLIEVTEDVQRACAQAVGLEP